jgi:hypothetical protein
MATLLDLECQHGSSDAIPVAHTRIVFGRKYSCIYIEYCPLCGLEHMHGRFALCGENSDPLEAYDWGGHRHSHCHCHGLGHVTRFRNGRPILVERPRPPEYRESQGCSYQLVLGPKPACFTAKGFKSKAARSAMAQLAWRGVPTSTEILRPRRLFILKRFD